MVSRIKERLLQYKQELQKRTIYKDGLPGSSLDIVNSLLKDLEQDEKENGWILVDERLPDPDEHILVSFFNFSLPMIGRYTMTMMTAVRLELVTKTRVFANTIYM